MRMKIGQKGKGPSFNNRNTDDDDVVVVCT